MNPENSDKTAEKSVDKSTDRFSEKSPEKSEKKWQFSSHDLKRALDSWQELNETKPGPAPDEKMLQDVQALLKELKDKIKEFSEK